MPQIGVSLSGKTIALLDDEAAKDEKWSRSSVAARLIERGPEAQPAEVADLVTALRNLLPLAAMAWSKMDEDASGYYVAASAARAALAPFEEAGK